MITREITLFLSIIRHIPIIVVNTFAVYRGLYGWYRISVVKWYAPLAERPIFPPLAISRVLPFFSSSPVLSLSFSFVAHATVAMSLDPASMKVAELRVALDERGLDSVGTKAVLQERLREALENEASATDAAPAEQQQQNEGTYHQKPNSN